jgi:DNA polymerase-3 subunit delta
MTDLDRALKGGPAPVWLIFGDARPMVEAAVDRVVSASLERCGLPAFNHSTYRASDTNAGAALSTARTLPMMAELRLVVLRDLEEGSEGLFEALLDYVSDPSPSTELVLTGQGFPPTRKGGKNWSARIQNKVKKTGRLLKYASKDVRAPQYARQEAERQGKQLGAREADLLVMLVGEDLGRLRQEIEKVSLFVGDRPRITANDLNLVCSMVAESVIWDLTSGIAARNADQALAALHRQLEEGENPRRLLGMVAWQLRSVLQAVELIAAGAPDGAVRKDTRIRFDLLRQLREAHRRGNAPDAATTLGRLARANQQMNQHRAGDRRIIENLILELCR